MIKKVIMAFIFILSIYFFTVQAKYTFSKEIVIANINIDTINPKIELSNIKNTLYKVNDKEIYSVSIEIRVIETYIKINEIEKIKIEVNKSEIKNYEIIKLESNSGEIVYEIKIDNLLKNQEIQIHLPKNIIIDNSNNSNSEQTINYKIL